MSHTEYFCDSTQAIKKLSRNENKENDVHSLVGGRAKSDLSKLNEINQLFKLPNFDSVHVKRANLSSFISQKKRIQSGTMEKEAKSVKQPKLSFRSCGSFIHSNTNPRRNQSRKELIEKMVYLTECALIDNKEIKHSTPVKMLQGLTPRKTPRSYLVLPEFEKKVQNLDEMRTPLKDFIKKEKVFGSSVKKNLAPAKNEIVNPIISRKIDDDFNGSNNISEIEFNYLESKTEIRQILEEFQKYNVQVTKLHDQQRILEDSFETKIKELPEYAIFEEFSQYQSKKQELNNKIKILEDNFTSAIRDQKNINENLKIFIKENRQLFDEEIKLHKEFEMVVCSAIKKLKSDDTIVKPKKEMEEKNVLVTEEKPKLRRSLRLSKIPKRIEVEEADPTKKNLLRLNSKSRGIHKTRKSPRYKRGKVLAL